MGTLQLVRHGQASFGADNYDQLSALGERQCERLGRYWQTRGKTFDAVLTGTLQRHRQSLEAIGRGLPGLPAAQALPGLNEYDSEALIAALDAGPLARPDTPEAYREYFKRLKLALSAWMRGQLSPAGMPSYADFSQGVRAALELVREQHAGHDVLLVSSGGPISTAIGQILQTPAEATIDLNMRMRNSAVTEVATTPRRHMLVTFNTLAHLDGPDERDWITHA